MSRLTERDLLDHLRAHYLPERRNGDEWAFLEHVRNEAGMNAQRTCDLLVYGLWPSRGLTVIGHEIKCSRADWLTELRNPAKADAFHSVVDAWYVVAANELIVQDGELPDGWGLMVPRLVRKKSRIEVVHQARLVPAVDRAPFSRSFVAALLKTACRTIDVTPEAIRAAEDRVREQQLELHLGLREADERRHEELLATVREFEKAAGVQLRGWYGGRDPEKVGAALRLVLSGDATSENAERRLAKIVEDAENIAAYARQLLAPKEEPSF